MTGEVDAALGPQGTLDFGNIDITPEQKIVSIHDECNRFLIAGDHDAKNLGLL